MAIKTTGSGSELRIITKTVDGEVRVSCECCAAGCCMYPADELGGLYTAADLPDALTINWTGQFTGTVTKSGSGYSGGGITLQVVNNSWQLAQGSTTRSVGNCLIRGDGNLTAENDLVEDQFEDTYTVTIEEVFSGTVSRTSLCEWSYSDGGIGITLGYSDFNHKWYVGGVSGEILLDWLVSAVSDGPQNKPDGATYTVQFAFNLGSGPDQFSTDGVVVTVTP